MTDEEYDEQIEREWASVCLPEIGWANVAAQVAAACRQGSIPPARETEAVVGISGGSVQGAEVLEQSGGIEQHEKGAKLDSGKSQLRFLLYFRRSLEAVADLAAQGAFKYTEGGFLEVEDGFNRYTDAMMRHLFKELETEYVVDDPEWINGVLEATAVAWNALARLEMKLKENEYE
jgi:hypothetical protein